VKRPGNAVIWMGWLATLALATIAMWVLRDHLEKAHVALLFLVIVLGGSATGGRALGLSLAALAFFAFDSVFLPPYGTLAVRNPLDWLVLLSFLVTSLVATQLLDRAHERAVAAQRRGDEIERLSILGAETLNAGVATDALDAIAEVIRSTLGVDRCEILAHHASGGAVAAESLTLLARASSERDAVDDRDAAATSDGLTIWVAEQGLPAVMRGDHTAQLGASGWESERDPWLSQGDVRVLLVPLLARGRAVGVLRIVHREQIVLRAEQREFLRALSYYAALGVERVRLVAAAERAEAFRQADALKTALIATVSHDLRTPLTTIKALAHRLAQGGDSDARSIEEEADRLSRFVGDLLDLSRLAANALPVRVEINAAEELVDAARRRLAGALQHRELRVLVADGAPLLLGRFDLVQSVRVLVNLIENALKYSPADAPVELAVSRRDDRLVLEVRDRGPGIPAGEETLIYEPFYRPAGTRPDVGGAGLGLAIARGLAEAQGGAVRYAPREGGGSVFSFELPAADPPELSEA
jgi:two-component system sensor histidine kinase KdpD